MAKITIILCTYNCEKYIYNTINSILDQTYKDYKILICDNNSKDNTKKVLKRFEKNKKIKIFYLKKNIGAYKGLNYLINKSNTKYIAIQDHDDIWANEKLEKQYEFLEKNKKYIACGTNTIIYYEKNKKYILKKYPKNSDITQHTSLMFKNKNYKYQNQKYFTDILFMKKISKKQPIYNIQEFLTLHLIRKDNKNLSIKWQKMEKINYKYINFKKIYNKIIPINIRQKIFFILKYKSIKKFNKFKYKNKYLKYINNNHIF